MFLSVGKIAQFSGAQVVGCSGDLEKQACGITWDSREVEPGFVYVALPGERVDGHSFVSSACKSGAVAVLVMQDLLDEVIACAKDCGTAVLRVDSTHDAFTKLAAGYRTVLSGRVIGITGSTGKTTTKNLVRDVLSAHFSCVATKANQNNELGVPRTLLNANPDTEMVVVEMGMRGQGQIEQLCSFVQPDWGLVTNVGESHIELLGSRENIVRAKAELIASLPQDGGVAFLNAADDMSEFVWECSGKEDSSVTKVCFDGSGKFDSDTRVSEPCVWAEEVSLDSEGFPSFMLCASGFARTDSVQAQSESSNADGIQDEHGAKSLLDDVDRMKCRLSLRGIHNVSNACSAAAVGYLAGMSLEEIVAALEASQPESGRQEILHSDQGFTVINDAYNANPDSMRASLSLLKAMQISGRRFAVLGDMGELGSFAEAAHESVGRFAARANIDFLICVGELARFIGQAAQSAGLSPDRISMVDTREEALAFLQEHIASGDAVLVKASHFMELDRIAKGLLS